MKNERIRQAAARNGVRLWQIAEELGMNDGNFSRKLRRELSEDEQNNILAIIERLATEVV